MSPQQYVPTSYTSMTIALDCDLSQLGRNCKEQSMSSQALEL